jgi:AbrB family looped-hinge helix DNA binding protein
MRIECMGIPGQASDDRHDIIGGTPRHPFIDPYLPSDHIFMNCHRANVMSARVRINQQGRIVIPAECRAAAGLKPGDDLLIEVVGEGELRLRTRSRALKEAQAIVARYLPKGRDLVQEFIDDRRKEAARE